MSKRLASTLVRLALLVVLIAALMPVVPVAASAKGARADYTEGQILVRFRDGVSAAAASGRAHTRTGASTKKRYADVNSLELVDLPAGMSVDEAIAAYSAMPEVLYAEPNRIISAAAPVIPNDEGWNWLWGLHNTGQTIEAQVGTSDADIDAPEAWGVTIGSPNVVVAVVDSGVRYTHPDLASNMWMNPGEIAGNGIDDDDNGYVDDVYGIDIANGDSDPADDFGHGTHCAGTIGAQGNNGVGVAGVNWDVSLMALKVLDSAGTALSSDAISALEYANAMGADVVNCSWGWGGLPDLALYDQIQAMPDTLFACAAGNGDGNNGDDNDGLTPFYPASYDLPNIISVGATDNRDVRASFSNYGATSVDLFAPGVSVLSTYVDPGNPSVEYVPMNGTSMAAPHVAGIAGLLLSVAPGLSVGEMKSVIMQSVDYKAGLSGFAVTGGRANANGAVTFLMTRIEQSDNARFAYEGPWSVWSNAALSGGSYAYGNSASSAVSLSFEGTAFALIARTGPEFGIASVSIDDGPPQDVDLYSATTRYEQSVTATSTLEADPHTVRVAWTGRRNAAAMGTYVNVDAVDIVPAAAQLIGAPQPIEQDAAGVALDGAWSTWVNGALSGGSYSYANAVGSAITFGFWGTQLDLIARTGPEFGIARVTVDGGEQWDVDLYSPTTLYRQRVYSTWPLDLGEHTVRIEWTGRKNAAAMGTYVNADRADVDGTQTEAPTRIEQSDNARFAYEGPWSVWSNAVLSGGSYAYGNVAESAATITFEGTAFALLARKGPEFGIASVSIDNGPPQDVELYSETTRYAQSVSATSTLEAGPHTVRVAWTGRKNDAATGTYVNVDAADIAPATAPAIVAPQAIEQDAAGVAHAGKWSMWANGALSGGSYAYANIPGAATTFSFSGTQLDLIARTGPEFGIAGVSVDGGTPWYVDLYSPGTLYQQRVYSTWPLKPGSHTVRIEWTGRKNAAASGTYINADRADVAP